MLVAERVSTGKARALPPASVISRATVLMVEAGELGSGGNGLHVLASEVVFALTTTVGVRMRGVRLVGRCVPVYPSCARERAIWRPIPREAPITRATFWSE